MGEGKQPDRSVHTSSQGPEEPDKFWFIEQLREAVGLPVPPSPITPKQAWGEAIEVVRRLAGRRPIDVFFDEFDGSDPETENQ